MLGVTKAESLSAGVYSHALHSAGRMGRKALAIGWGILLWLAVPVSLNAQYTYTTNNGTITITGYTGPGGTVVIPDTIDGLPVVSIGNDAFLNCTALTGITIPPSVTNIGWYAFSGTSLTSVTIPNGVTLIGPWTFFACTNLTSVAIPDSVIAIAMGAFQGCSSLTSITIPDSVTAIGGSTFQGCRSLTGIFFEGNAPRFSHDAFGFNLIATVYYLPGTTGWSPIVEGLPTAPWVLPEPLILTTPPDFGVGTNGYGFIISWATNASVVVEACTDLALPDWSPVGTNTLVDGWSYFSDPEWTNNRFYRLRSR